MFLLAAISAGSMQSVVVGATAVAVLYALHHLRVQPIRRPVATLIFWNEATPKQSARVPWASRLTHFWTFVLLSLIGIAIAASLSADQWLSGRNDSKKNAIVIDTGASMTAISRNGEPTALSVAVLNAIKDLDSISGTPAIISAGTQAALLVQPGDPLAVAKRRLAKLVSSDSASASERALNLAGDVIGTGTGTIFWYTNRDELPAGVASAIAGRVKIIRQPLPSESVAIIGADFASKSGNELSGTLHVRLAGESAKSFTVEERLDHGTVQEQTVNLVNHQADVSFENVQADGQPVTLSIRGAPGATAEQTTKFELPLRIPLRFAFIGTIPRPLRLALLTMGVEDTVAGSNVIVLQQGQPAPAGASSIIEVIEQGPAFASGTLQVNSGSSLLAGLSFEGVAVEGGPAISSTSQPLLQVGAAVVAGFSDSGGRKTLYLSQAIVSERSLVSRRAAFPVFLSRLSTDLVDWSAAPAVVTSLRQIVDPLWNATGTMGSITSTVFEPPLIAGALPKPTQAGSVPSIVIGFSAMGWSEWILALALLMLVLESWLYSAKKIV